MYKNSNPHWNLQFISAWNSVIRCYLHVFKKTIKNKTVLSKEKTFCESASQFMYKYLTYRDILIFFHWFNFYAPQIKISKNNKLMFNKMNILNVYDGQIHNLDRESCIDLWANLWKPSMEHTTAASSLSHKSSQTVPQEPSLYISTRPSREEEPWAKRTAPSIHTCTYKFQS